MIFLYSNNGQLEQFILYSDCNTKVVLESDFTVKHGNLVIKTIYRSQNKPNKQIHTIHIKESAKMLIRLMIIIVLSGNSFFVFTHCWFDFKLAIKWRANYPVIYISC